MTAGIVKDKGDYVLTNYHVPTRRAVIWLGQKCNINCYFCYFAARVADRNHPEHPFMSLEKAQEICRIFREEYDLNSIDIQGGEPTIYPHIFELMDYCNAIGLKPSLITNLIALNNYSYCAKFKEHGVFDLLVSLQAIGEEYDRIVGMKNGFKRQLQALDNIEKLGIPIRVNTVLLNDALPQLREICQLAVRYKARVMNFLGYNNYGDQDRMREKAKVPRYGEIARLLEPLMDYLEGHDIEVNMRFYPFCIFHAPYRKNVHNQNQKIFDLHEWEQSSRIWIDAPHQRQAKQPLDKLPDLFRATNIVRLRRFKGGRVVKNVLRAEGDFETPAAFPYQEKIHRMLARYRPAFNERLKGVDGFSKVEYYYMEANELYNPLTYIDKCKSCDVYPICDGLYCDFIRHFGDGEIEPVKDFGKRIYDPRVYLNAQMKVVEREEFPWALPRVEKTP